jgi:hypothetical protein
MHALPEYSLFSAFMLQYIYMKGQYIPCLAHNVSWRCVTLMESMNDH